MGCDWRLRKRHCYRSKITPRAKQISPGSAPKCGWACFERSNRLAFRWFLSPGRRGQITRGSVAFFLPRFELDHWRIRGTRGKRRWGCISNRHLWFQQRRKINPLLFVLFLYIILWPHSLQRIGSRGLISFFAPQSGLRKRLASVRERGVEMVHLRKGTPSRVSDPCKGMRQTVNWQPVVVDS